MTRATDIFRTIEREELFKTFTKGRSEMTPEQQDRIQAQQQTLIKQKQHQEYLKHVLEAEQHRPTKGDQVT